MNTENIKYNELVNESIEDVFGNVNVSNSLKSLDNKDLFEQNKTEKTFIPKFLMIEREKQYKLRIISSPVACKIKLPNNIPLIQKFMAHVIDRSDNKVKIWTFGTFLLKQIQELIMRLNINMEKHDLIIYRNSEGKHNMRFDDKITFQEIPSNLIDLNKMVQNNPNMFVSEIPTL